MGRVRKVKSGFGVKGLKFESRYIFCYKRAFFFQQISRNRIGKNILLLSGSRKLGNFRVSDKSVEAFAEYCPELEYVGFMGCSVTSRGVICLTNLKNLSSLDLRHINELDNETVMEIVKKCQSLTSLNLCLNRNIDDR
ncbi:hypothetical protein GDO81_002530 [Engystomops pustulosus]|uniref:Uncharacterized protein n=1 Tax=Engystomops pustulosus TaxID=76066 RepID=A0AAV7DL20_ENGPU|nr:hypothetical protein GDO81_002530 [Engystomops pustulosus]